jgi:FkbM family methyltransferase
MINQPWNTRMPRRWWLPAARPSGSIRQRVEFYLIFATGLPFAIVGYFRFGAFRFPGRFAELLGSTNRHPGFAVMPRGKQQLEFPVLDRYWSRLMFRTYRFELELDDLLNHSNGEVALFVDGGANIGLWSVVASEFVPHVVAIDASPSTLPILRANCKRNADGYEVVEAALWSSSDETISFSFSSKAHAGSSITSVSGHDLNHGDWANVEIQTITVDSLVERSGVTDSDGITIVKLDVEGAEVEAMRGAETTLKSPSTILVYEEHGRNHDHLPTAFLLERGLQISYLDRGGLHMIHTVEDISKVASEEWMGYNFVATVPGGPAAQLVERVARDSARRRPSAR